MGTVPRDDFTAGLKPGMRWLLIRMVDEEASAFLLDRDLMKMNPSLDCPFPVYLLKLKNVVIRLVDRFNSLWN